MSSTATVSSGGSDLGDSSTTTTMRKNDRSESGGFTAALNRAVGVLLISVLGWTLLSTQQHAERLSAYDQRLQSLDAKVTKLESSVDKLWDRVDRGFSDLRNQINSAK